MSKETFRPDKHRHVKPNQYKVDKRLELLLSACCMLVYSLIPRVFWHSIVVMSRCVSVV